MAEIKVRGDRVEVEAFYDDDTPARNARVTVTDAAGNKIAEGLTDAQGRWSFSKPATGTITVIADAGAGHRYQADFDIPPNPPTAAPTDDDQPIRTGPSRAELTAIPWAR